MTPKPVLVGWAPPACRPRSRPWEGNAGSRLALLLGLPSRDALLRLVEPERLFDRPNPSVGRASLEAAGLALASRVEGRRLLLAGRLVCRALGVPPRPRYVWRRARLPGGYEAEVAVLAFPSGRNRDLDDPSERAALRALFAGCIGPFPRQSARARHRDARILADVQEAQEHARRAREADNDMRAPDDRDRLLTPEEAGKLCGISKRSVLRHVQLGNMPHIRISERIVRFRRADILLWVDRLARFPGAQS